METLIAKALEEALEPYKEHFFIILPIILLIYTLISFAIQRYFNFKLTKKVELLKNDLRKNEIKFSKHSELQIECLKTMYNNVVDLHFAFIRSLSLEDTNHHSFKRNFINLTTVFSDNMDYFHRNKILFTDEIINHIRVLKTNFKVIEKEIKIQLNELSELEELHLDDDPKVLYINNEKESLTNRIFLIRTVPEAMTFENEIKKTRDSVEKYFRSLL